MDLLVLDTPIPYKRMSTLKKHICILATEKIRYPIVEKLNVYTSTIGLWRRYLLP
jgi:hypothetical protein